MTDQKSSKITMLQYRTDISEDHEIKCFQDEFGKHFIEFEFINAVRDELDPEILDNSDGMIIGGSTEFNLTKGHGKNRWLNSSYNLIDEAISRDLPTLGVCFGFQILVQHQGGNLVNNSDFYETGSHKINLKKEADNCELFSQLPDEFFVQLGHKDTPTELPENTVSLASSSKVEHQAFRLKNKPVWGVLFHPELNQVTAKERLSMFLDYPIDSEEFLEKIGEIKNSSASAQIIHKFIDFAIQEND